MRLDVAAGALGPPVQPVPGAGAIAEGRVRADVCPGAVEAEACSGAGPAGAPPAEERPAARLARIAADVIGAAWCAVYRLPDAAGAFALEAVHGAAAERLPDARALRFLADGGRPRAGGTERMLCVPLRRDLSLRGLLVFGARPAGRFTARDRAVADELAQLAAPGLEEDGGPELPALSHELRTPLAALVGYLEMLADVELGTLTGPQADALRGARRTALELREAVAVTLELGRLDAGRTRLAPSAFALDALLAEVVEEARCQAAPGVELAWSREAGAPAVCTDRPKLKIVLRNLVGNALKFTARGRVALSAHAEEGRLTLAVRDTGVGIAPRDLPFVFERFRQGGVPPAHAADGAGLGLHIVQRLVALLGGTVAVASEEGAGTTVEIRLPVLVPAGPDR